MVMNHDQLQSLAQAFKESQHSVDTVVVCPDGETFHFGDTQAHDPLMLHIRNMQMLRMFTKNPKQGLKKSYLKGFWDCNNIPQLLAMSLPKAHYQSSCLLKQYHHSPVHPRVLKSYPHDAHRLKTLTLEFFATWLDPSLSHSIATFSLHKKDPLYIAQQKSLQTVLKTLQHYHAVSVLETHAGWGSLAEKSCLHHDVTLVTSSRQHAEFCQNRLQCIPIPVNYQIKTQRPSSELFQPFDAAVGTLPPLVSRQGWFDYFGYLASQLKPGGIAIVQLAIDQQSSPRLLSRVLDKYRFELLEQTHLNRNAAKTYRYWLNNFSANFTQIEKLGFSRVYLRQWQYYLSEMAFYFEADLLQARQIIIEKYLTQ